MAPTPQEVMEKRVNTHRCRCGVHYTQHEATEHKGICYCGRQLMKLPKPRIELVKFTRKEGL